MNLPEQIRIDTTNKTFECNDQLYHWHGGFGAIFKSYERGVKAGEVRVIGNVLFHAAYVWKRGWFGKPECCWSFDVKDTADIHRIKSAIFNP